MSSESLKNTKENLRHPLLKWHSGCSLLMGHSCGRQDDVVADRSAGMWGIRLDRHDELVAMVRNSNEGDV